MSALVRITPKAEQDMIAMRVWYEQEGGKRLGLRFVDAMSSTAAFLADNPEVGRVREWKRETNPRLKGIRQWRVDKPFQKSLVFYQIIEDRSVLIVRVLRGERNLDAILETDE